MSCTVGKKFQKIRINYAALGCLCVSTYGTQGIPIFLLPHYEHNAYAIALNSMLLNTYRYALITSIVQALDYCNLCLFLHHFITLKLNCSTVHLPNLTFSVKSNLWMTIFCYFYFSKTFLRTSTHWNFFSLKTAKILL